MKLHNIKTAITERYIKPLGDVRNLGLIVFAAIVLLVTWSGIKAVQANYDLQREIAGLRQANGVSGLENENQKLKNQYLGSDEFLELAARRQFGLAAPGERLVLIPKSVAMAHSYSLTVPAQLTSTGTTIISKPRYQRNFEAWINFFLHRQTVGD